MNWRYARTDRREQSTVGNSAPGGKAGCPRYSLSRRKTGATHGPKHSRLSWALVREIRQWAARDGYGLSRVAQMAKLRESYPVHPATLRDVLENRTWHDPAYQPGEPDLAYFKGRPLTQIVLRSVQQWGAER